MNRQQVSRLPAREWSPAPWDASQRLKEQAFQLNMSEPAESRPPSIFTFHVQIMGPWPPWRRTEFEGSGPVSRRWTPGEGCPSSNSRRSSIVGRSDDGAVGVVRRISVRLKRLK